MKTEFEVIKPDEESSFRVLIQRVTAETFGWHYHYHPEYELVFVTAGTGRRHVGNHLSYYDDGDLALIGSNLPHSGFGYETLGIHEEIVIQFKEDFLGESFFKSPEMKKINHLLERSKQGVIFSGETKVKVGEKMKLIENVHSFERAWRLIEILHDLANSEEFLYLNSADTKYDYSVKDDQRLQRIYKFVEENYKKNIELKEVADIAALSVPSFCNYFKKMMNLTFTYFVNEYRINQACRLLYLDSSIVDVCYAVGFNNVSYFSKVFREIKGKTPSEYKNLVLRKK